MLKIRILFVVIYLLVVQEAILGQDVLFSDKVDKKEFAPGYPDYNISALEQLRRFPAPRFEFSNRPPRNFPWFAINYLSRDFSRAEYGSNGRNDPQAAVLLMDELVRHWNYFIEIPCLRRDSADASEAYGDTATIEGKLVWYANSHPEIPVATITNQLQNDGRHLGFGHKNFIRSQDLPDFYYLRDRRGGFLKRNGRKILSPLMPLDIVEKDGQVSRMYLRQLLKHLNRPIDFINENGEVFGHTIPFSTFAQDPTVYGDMMKRGVDASTYSGWFQNRIDSCYRATILSERLLSSSRFTFYNVSEVKNEYWPDYPSRMNTNSLVNGHHRSTPSFYVRYPSIWRIGRGPSNGYGALAWGRYQEIQLGQPFFSPFVSAGWGLEEQNVRAGQWLGLLKAMTMLGADFFYTGYFNVTGTTGWANGRGPNDPRGYIYQIAMPAYAQAVASKYKDYILRGQLINPRDTSRDKLSTFMFRTGNASDLVLVRKLDSRYLIYGSIQPGSNELGSMPASRMVSINVEDHTITFEIRRQGSTYILDLSDRRKPTFKSLDYWHQYEHPYYWRSDLLIEAEDITNLNGGTVVTTTKSDTVLNFANFSTFVRLHQGDSLVVPVPLKRLSFYSLSLKLGDVLGNSEIIIEGYSGRILRSVSSSDSGRLISFSKDEVEKIGVGSWTSICITSKSGVVDIDKIIL